MSGHWLRRRFRRRRSARGAVAILAAALALVLLLFAALAVDITSQVFRKHQIQDQLDQAAVSAGFYMDLSPGSLAKAVSAAQAYYLAHYDQTLDLHNIDFWCVVQRNTNKTTGQPDPADPNGMIAPYQVPANQYQPDGTCNPDSPGTAEAARESASPATYFPVGSYQNETRTWDGTKFSMVCGETMCAIPCGLKAAPDNGWNAGGGYRADGTTPNSLSGTTWNAPATPSSGRAISCNTIRVSASRGVPFSFAPAGGIARGSTGAQESVACKGPCGAVAPNPMNIVVVADHTPSMSTADRADLVNGIRSMLTVMTPKQQFVTLGTIARSYSTNRSTAESQTCATPYNDRDGSINVSSGKTGLTFPSTNVNSGLWVPLKFHDDYLTAAGDVDGTKIIGKALTCLNAGNSYDGGTSLAAPLKAAVRYLLGNDPNNINSELHGSSRAGEIRNVIIFETDGQPQEWGTNSNDTSLGSATDPMSDYDHVTTTTGTGAISQLNLTNVPASSLGLSTTPASTYGGGSASVYVTYNWNGRTYYYCGNATNHGTAGGVSAKTLLANQADFGTWYVRSGSGFGSTVTKPTSETSSSNAPRTTDNYCQLQTLPPTYQIAFNAKQMTADNATYKVYDGGQQACRNLQSVAEKAKAAGILIITIGYNINSGKLCGDNNSSTGTSDSRTSSVVAVSSRNAIDACKSSSVTGDCAWISDISPTTGTWGTATGARKADCVSGSGTLTSPYVLLTGSCKLNVTETYTVYKNMTGTYSHPDGDNPDVASVLAAVSGGTDIPASTSNGCSNATAQAQENNDGDYFYCAASGTELAPIFKAALAQVTTGVKLIRMP